MSLILASSSPRRLELLQSIDIKPDFVISPQIDETPLKNELPRALALRLAHAKALAVSNGYSNSYIIAADTVVACGRRILPKAESIEDIIFCLKLLSGRRHKVYTGVCIISPQGKISQRVVQSIISLKQLSNNEILSYANTQEGIGKAGGYAIQGKGALFAKFISGSYHNIVGLPLYDIYQILQGLGYQFFK